jgi:MarR-like DNA-binding transcriptional regulator SgrR of sgrS sRNA
MESFSLDVLSRAQGGKGRLLLTVAEAAEALGCSDRHIKRLIHEADATRKSRWRWGRELVDLSPVGAQRRTVRINARAVVPEL